MDNERFQRNDNLAPFFDSSKSNQKDVSRSSFDFSRSHSFQLDFGMLSVADCFETIPNGTYKLSSNINAQFRIPTNRKLINNCRIFVEYYYCKESDLWEGAHNTVTKGRSGNINKEYPHLVFNFQGGDDASYKVRFDTPDSLMDDFGIPCSVSHKQGFEGATSPRDFYKPILIHGSNTDNYVELLEDNDGLFINALPFTMYQKVCRDYYLPKNLIQDNKYILPDNEEHFILPYNASAVGYLDYDMPISQQDKMLVGQGMFYNDYNFSNTQTKVILAQKRFRQFRGDTFTTSFPFPDGVRGDIPVLNFDFNSDGLSINIPDLPLYGTYNGDEVDHVVINSSNQRYAYLSNSNTSALVPFNAMNVTAPSSDGGSFVNPSDVRGVRGQSITFPSFTSSITLNDIRTLEAFTVFQERMARTDGDYSEMLKAQFGYTNVKTDRRPVYIGGFFQDILVNSVYQTSESTSNSPLGKQSGIGISSGSHQVGSFTAPDFGYIMAIISVVPEVYYNTGIERMFSRRVQSDKYFPVMNDLPPDAILNKELFVQGNETVDSDVFSYQERNSEYKSRRNVVTGKGRFFTPVINEQTGLRESALPIDYFDNSRVIVKNLITTPNLNADFVTAQDVDLSVFSVTDEMPIDMDFGSIVRAILPMPYVSIPGGLDDNY